MGVNTSRVAHSAIGYELTHAEYHGLSTHTLTNLVTGRGATKVVAASDSLNPGNADYTCNGIADDVTIQLAITAAGAGGRVLLLAGLYDIRGHLLPPSYSTVMGEGWGTHLKLANHTAAVDVFRNSDISGGNTRITIRDLRIDGNRGNQTAGRYGIYFKNVDYSNILNCWIDSCYVEGIQLNLSDHNLIMGCECYDSRVNNIGLVDSSFNRIVNNILRSSSEGMGLYVNYSASVSLRNIIMGNDCISNNHEGIGVRPTCDKTIIVGNYCYANGDNGISVSGQFNTVIGNIVDSNQYHGIGLDGSDFNLIQGNVCLSNGTAAAATYSGIRLTNGATYNNIANNLCKGTSQKYGIDILDGTGSSDNNRVLNNMLQGNATGPLNDEGTNVILFNYGHVSENSGTSSITSGQTTKVVAHGLSATPTVISIEFREQGTADYGRWWVDTIGASNFTLNVSADPGASNLDFAWEAKVR